MGSRALKLMVVLLCTLNCVVWYSYTEMPIMAAIWGGTAIGFLFWIIYDVKNR